MKGLILKDLYLLKGFGKQYGIILAFMALWGLVMKAVSFLCIYAVLMGAMIILSIMTLDDAVSFNRFVLTMPVNERTLIKSKYFLFIISVGAGAFIAFLVSSAAAVLPVEWNQTYNWGEIMPSVTIFVIGTAIAFPVILSKGAEKGRYVYIAAMFGMGAGIYLAAKFCQSNNISLDVLETIPNWLYVILFTGICTISLVISYFVSLKAVQNKEW